MNTSKHHRFATDVISYVVILYYRFSYSPPDIDNLLAERGVIVSRETVRPDRLQNLTSIK